VTVQHLHEQLLSELNDGLTIPRLRQRRQEYLRLVGILWGVAVLAGLLAALIEYGVHARGFAESLSLGVVWAGGVGFIGLSIVELRMELPETFYRIGGVLVFAPCVVLLMPRHAVIVPILAIALGIWSVEFRDELDRAVRRRWNGAVALFRGTPRVRVLRSVAATSSLVRRCLRTGDPGRLPEAIENLITAYAQAGRSGEYPELLAPVLRFARENRDRPREIYFLGLIGIGLGYRGEHSRALELTVPLLSELPECALAFKQVLQRAANRQRIDPRAAERAASAGPLFAMANTVLCLYQEIGLFREARAVGEPAVIAAMAVDGAARRIHSAQADSFAIVDLLQLNLADLLLDENESPDRIESHLAPGRSRRAHRVDRDPDQAGLAAYVEAKAAARREMLPSEDVERALDQAIAFYEEFKNAKFAAQLWLWKGVLRHRRSDVAGCRHALDEANALDDVVLDRVFPVCPDAAKPALIQSIRHRFDAWLSLFFRHFSGDPASSAFAYELCLRRKGLATSIQTARRAEILVGRFPELEEPMREYLRVCRALADIASGKETAGNVTDLEQRRQGLEIQLSRMVPELGSTKEESKRLALVRGLAPGTLLIDYLQYHRYDLDAVFPEPFCGESRYAAFVVTAANPDQVQVLDLGPAATIDALVQDITEDNDPPEVSGTERSHRGLGEPRPKPRGMRFQEACNGLYERIVMPCLAAVPAGQFQRLLLSPDAALHRVSFETLRDPAGSGLLIDPWEVSYSTAVCGLKTAIPSEGKGQPPRTSIVVADPDFDAVASLPGILPVSNDDGRPGPGSLGSMRSGFARADRLPMAGAEGQFVREQLGTTTLLCGAQATDGSLKQECQSPRVLHICTHGWFLEDDLESRRTSAEGVPLQGSTDPFLRSWLILAGFNVWKSDGILRPGTEDGIVTAADILALDLSGTELVVLSACETGLGSIQNGEGVAGLRRAFAVAGAKCLVMTLWRVHDLASMLLMQGFYQALERESGLNATAVSAALRQAKLRVRGMSAADALSSLQSLPAGVDEKLVESNREWLRALAPAARPFEHPVYWGGFVVEQLTL